jgi:hypothetical protein
MMQSMRGITKFSPTPKRLASRKTHVISPGVVNSATLGWVRPYAASVTARNGTGGPVPASLVFLPGGNPGQIAIGGGATTVAPASVTPAPGNNPLRDIREFYSVGDDLRFTKGKHSFSAGVWVQRIHENHLGAPQFSAGGVSYTTMPVCTFCLKSSSTLTGASVRGCERVGAAGSTRPKALS